MLILTRKSDQSVFLDWNGETIEIRVFSCFGGQVRMGFDAPAHVKILREELMGKINLSDKYYGMINLSEFGIYVDSVDSIEYENEDRMWLDLEKIAFWDILNYI